jgi:hypothetical protein
MHQAERTIRGALESLLRQTLRDLEIVVVDDGSTDAGPAVVASVAVVDPRVRLVTSDRNRGVAAALNLGLRHARSALVARLDADDAAEPHRLERQVAAFREDPELVVCGSTVRYIGRGGRQIIGSVPFSDTEIRAELANSMHSPFFHPAVMMRRSAVQAVGGYRTEFRNSEDYDLWLRIRHEGRFLNLAEPLTRYRISPQGATLGRLAEQRRYAVRAREEAVASDIPALPASEGDLTAYVVKEQRAFAELLADLGHPWAAVRHLVRVRADVGSVAAARFAARRVVRGTHLSDGAP